MDDLDIDLFNRGLKLLRSKCLEYYYGINVRWKEDVIKFGCHLLNSKFLQNALDSNKIEHQLLLLSKTPELLLEIDSEARLNYDRKKQNLEKDDHQFFRPHYSDNGIKHLTILYDFKCFDCLITFYAEEIKPNEYSVGPFTCSHSFSSLYIDAGVKNYSTIVELLNLIEVYPVQIEMLENVTGTNTTDDNPIFLIESTVDYETKSFQLSVEAAFSIKLLERIYKRKINVYHLDIDELEMQTIRSKIPTDTYINQEREVRSPKGPISSEVVLSNSDLGVLFGYKAE